MSLVLALVPIAEPALAGGEAEALQPAPRGAARVFLVRHGQAFTNLDPEPDLPPEQLDRLTPLGHAQAQRTAEALRASEIARVLSSPAGRARESAEAIGRSLACPVRVEPRLRPLELGRGASGAALDWDFRIAEWEAGRDPAPEAGESMEAMGKRVLELVQELARTPGRAHVLVAHGEVIGAFVGELSGTPPAKRWPPSVPNASITVVEARAHGAPRVLLTSYVPPTREP